MANVAPWSGNSTIFLYTFGGRDLSPLYYLHLYLYTFLYRVTTLTTVGTLRPYGAERSVARSVAKCPNVVTTAGLPPRPSRE